ncbi:hypothetical protein NUU61_001030 [Penicillium alfredii]|uniref:Uncharacterized protein n=1 Tax=Penicillium alfredii TaxID=1506179 RepID=A0A9W9GAQ3_9EURO|nr:uncharacterized protein NUU61_001030 [Penicillium alfredii]KAJ5115271.1 hypothetical protein NUU61_001030 [Penicillium alfredii]
MVREPQEYDNGVYRYDTPHGTWRSSESRLAIGPFGPERVREASPGRPVRANDSPSRTVYRGSDPGRAIEYVRRGIPDPIVTRNPGDFHRQPQNAAYFTFSEDYADRCARNRNSGGMVIQQRVPSQILDRGYNYPEAPGSDWRSTIYHNRALDPTPRHPSAVGESRRRDITIGPTAEVDTNPLLRRVRNNPSGPRYEAAFSPAMEDSSSDDSDIDEHRRGRRYVQQIRFQDQALDELASLPRHARPNLENPIFLISI